MQERDSQHGGPIPGTLERTRAPAGGRARISPEEKNKLRWLGDFLGDDSPAVSSEVRAQFRRAGRPALTKLKRLSRSADPRVRMRARGLLLEHARRVAYRRLCGYLTSSAAPDLERTLLLLARYADPRLDVRAVRQRLDALAAEVGQRMRERNDELHRCSALVDVLGRQHGFGGSAQEFHHPDNIHLNRALERRAGMPLTLCVIYLLVGARAGIRTAILPLPGHVMLRVYAGARNLIVDPYERGRLRSERDCRTYLEQNGLGYQPSWFQDASTTHILRRQLMNLQKSALARGRRAEARAAQSLMLLLERSARAPAQAR